MPQSNASAAFAEFADNFHAIFETSDFEVKLAEGSTIVVRGLPDTLQLLKAIQLMADEIVRLDADLRYLREEVDRKWRA